MKETLETVAEIIRKVKPQIGILEENTVLGSSLLDSLSVMAIVTLLEEEFQLEISCEYLEEKNFKTVGSIVRMIEQIGAKNRKEEE